MHDVFGVLAMWGVTWGQLCPGSVPMVVPLPVPLETTEDLAFSF